MLYCTLGAVYSIHFRAREHAAPQNGVPSPSVQFSGEKRILKIGPQIKKLAFSGVPCAQTRGPTNGAPSILLLLSFQGKKEFWKSVHKNKKKQTNKKVDIFGRPAHANTLPTKGCARIFSLSSAFKGKRKFENRFVNKKVGIFGRPTRASTRPHKMVRRQFSLSSVFR